MDRNRYLQWTVSSADSAVANVGYQVELAEDPLFSRVAVKDNSFTGRGRFEYRPSSTWVTVPLAGLNAVSAGTPVRYRLQTAKFLQNVVIAKNGSLYRLSAYDQSILESAEIPKETRYIATDRLTNDTWVTTSGAALVFPQPFSAATSRLLPLTVQAVIPDGTRSRYWTISTTQAKLYRFDGSLIATISLPAYRWVGPAFCHPQTGHLYMILRSDSLNSTFVCCRADNTSYTNNSLAFRDLTVWKNGVVLVAASKIFHLYDGSTFTSNWVTASGSTFTGFVSISGGAGDSIYVVDAVNSQVRCYSSDATTISTSPSWTVAIPASRPGSTMIRANLDMDKSGRIIHWWDCQAISPTTDSNFGVTTVGSIRDLTSSGQVQNGFTIAPDDNRAARGAILSVFRPCSAWARITASGGDEFLTSSSSSSYSKSSFSSMSKSSFSTSSFGITSGSSSSSATLSSISSSSSSSSVWSLWSSSSSRNISSSSSSKSRSSGSSSSFSSSTKSSQSSSRLGVGHAKNTAFDGSVVLPYGTVDPNWRLIQDPDHSLGSISASVCCCTLSDTWPDLGTASSRFIHPVSNGMQPSDQAPGNGNSNYKSGTYAYETTFTSATPFRIRARADDSMVVYLNGNNLGSVSGYGGWTFIDVASGFISGTNTIRCVSLNGPLYTGIQVEFIYL